VNKVKERPIKLPKMEFCPLCRGSGLIESGDETKECPMCKGEGKKYRRGTKPRKWGIK